MLRGIRDTRYGISYGIFIIPLDYRYRKLIDPTKEGKNPVFFHGNYFRIIKFKL